MKEILANWIENTDVIFEHSDPKIDTSADSPNKKRRFLVYMLLKKNVQRVII